MDRPDAADPAALDSDAARREVNEMRRRGAGEEAKAHALRIVAAHPNDAEAKALLGEICRDAGENEEAARWFGLALADDPNCLAARRRLGIAAVPRRWPLAGVVFGAGLLLLLLAIAFRTGERGAERNGGPDRITAPRPADPPRPGPGTDTRDDLAGSQAAMSVSEAALLERLRASGEGARNAVLLTRDPATGEVTLTLRVGSGEPPRPSAVAAARLLAPLIASNAALRVRVLRGGELAFVGRLSTVNAAGAPEPQFREEWSPDAPSAAPPDPPIQPSDGSVANDAPPGDGADVPSPLPTTGDGGG